MSLLQKDAQLYYMLHEEDVRKSLNTYLKKEPIDCIKTTQVEQLLTTQ